MRNDYDYQLQLPGMPAQEWCSMFGCNVKTDNGGDWHDDFYCADCLKEVEEKEND